MKKPTSQKKSFLIITACSWALFFLLLPVLSFADISSELEVYLPFNVDAEDQSGFDNDVIMRGPVSTDGRLGGADKAYEFDGYDDYIEVQDLGIKEDLTLSAWVFFNNLEGGQRQGIISKGYQSSAVTYRSYSLYVNNDTEVVFAVSSHSYNFIGGTLVSNAALSAFSEETWHHIAAVFSAGESMKIYIDGVEKSGDLIGTVPAAIAVNSIPELIGMDGETGGFLDGKIDEVRIYSRALSDSDIGCLYDDSDCRDNSSANNGGEDNCTDQDKDGFSPDSGVCGEVDCNDNDSAIYPGANDICDDMIDNDCNGIADDCLSPAFCIPDAVYEFIKGTVACEENTCRLKLLLNLIIEIINCLEQSEVPPESG